MTEPVTFPVPSPEWIIVALATCAALLLALCAVLVFRLQGARSRAATHAVQLETRLEQADSQIDQLQDELHGARAHGQAADDDCAQLRQALARLEERQTQSQRSAEEKIALLNNAREHMKSEFDTLAQRIFDDSHQRLLQANKAGLEHTLTPLRSQLDEFRRKVDDVYDRESRDRVSLRAELNQLKQLNVQMSQDALNLTRALKGDKKRQGNWGEMVLERVLEQSGLRKGQEYETQVHLRSPEGERRLPDAIIRLPGERDVVVDSKVSLVDYEQFVNAQEAPEREQALARHTAAIGRHIESLSQREYDKLEGIRSLDFVLLFVPIEAAFMAAWEAQPVLFQRAYEVQVIVVSPTTLLATLRTIHALWRREQQDRNARKIARMAGGIFDQFALVLESVEEAGQGLERAQTAYTRLNKRLTSGRGNLVKRVQQLQELGAQTRKELPESMLGEVHPEDHPTTRDTSREPDNE